MVPGLKWMKSFDFFRDAVDISWSADGIFLGAVDGGGNVSVWSESAHHSLPAAGLVNPATEVHLAWHPSQPVLAVPDGELVRIWDVATNTSHSVGPPGAELCGIAWSPDGGRLALGEVSGEVIIWDLRENVLLQHARVHEQIVYSLCWTRNGQALLTGSGDSTLNLLATDDLKVIRSLRGHTGPIGDVTLSPDQRLIASSSADSTVRIWDFDKGTVVAVLEGHTESVLSVRFSPNADLLGSLSLARSDSEPASNGLTLWRCRDWAPAATYPQPAAGIGGLAFHPSEPLLAVKNQTSHWIDCYRIDYALLGGAGTGPSSRRYGNAKVVLLGDTGVGKSGLGLVLSGQPYRPTDSTHGRNVWTLDAEDVEVPGAGTQTREVLLWDLAGQPGYRIIHQLHLNEVAVALLVFDSRSETDPFSGVKYWARALAQARRLDGAAAVPLRAYLVAARADRGGAGVSAERLRAIVDNLGLDGFFETSAKEGWHVAELTEAIRDGIDWDALPMISSSTLFDAIKSFLLEEKQHGRLLCTTDDLFNGFRREYSEGADDGTLRASFETCIGRVESRGLIRRLHFGDLVLLQPELLDAYASGMVQAAREEPDGLGFIGEEEALAGQFRLGESERIADGLERLLLIATVEELLRHEIALKEITDQGVDLVFPSQFTRERPDAPDIPGKEVTFAFEGPLHNIYATLAVRLSHSTLFRRQAMWQNAASYTATVGGMCGMHLRELEEGRGELVLFYDEQASRAVRNQFETYVADHLRLRAIPRTLTRRVTRTCPGCDYVLPEDLVRRRLQLKATTMRCPACEEAVISLLEEPAAPADVAVAEMNRSADKRRDQSAAALRLKGKMETGDYDVFLCYNSKDRAEVAAIGDRLKEHGVLPWLDIWAIRPGTRWQKELHKCIKSIRSAAVFIGPRGAGPWQELEVESILGQLAKAGCPIIPVILEGRQSTPRLPAFLGGWHVVDMRQPEPDPFEQLVWGITGERSARF
jgi:WD40 repeat protein